MTKPAQIRDATAYPSSFPLAADATVTLGIGRTVKRDAVIIKVSTEDGLVGFGESHHGRCPGAVAHLVNTTLRQLVVGMDAFDVVGVWKRIYKMQLSSHGMGTAAAMAMSGIDMALWDIRGKAVGWPLYRLFGGSSRPIPAYAGGVSLGYQEPGLLLEEVGALVEAGYRAVKLRVGDTRHRDLERVAAVRKTFGDDLTILVDANTGYSVDDTRQLIPEFESYGVGWLEEPFPDHDRRSYALAATFGTLPLASGENRYTRFEFSSLIEDGIVQILQPDLSKTGGPTEALRIAAMASAHKMPIHPHTSITGLNMAATIHFLASIDNGGYFEADVSKNNWFRDELVSQPYTLDAEGCVHPIDKPGIGLEVDEEFLVKHPVIEGPAYV
ncbi:MAG: mandelate racemase/muconate lactonizing enzyme family protein [Desulfobacterales bacterium]|nr:MAG: mandelate racemase/muconate lactonizing enzyme family protein [Desulfobacterales bacterium]